MKFLNIFKEENGFTLTEVLVASGLLGVIGVGVMFGTKTMKNMDKSSKQSSALQVYNTDGLNKLKIYTQGLTWEKFDFRSTYVQVNQNNKIKTVNWDFTDIDNINNNTDLEVSISDNSGNTFKVKRDSHTLVYSKNGKVGVYFSRCVPKNQYYKGGISPSQALSFKRVPFLVKDGERNAIYCCPQKSTGICSLDISDSTSSFRYMTFDLRDQGSFRSSPSQGDAKFFLGSGFMVYLNRGKKPDAFKALYFNSSDPCYRANDKATCIKEGIKTVRAVNGEISSKSVFESGQLIIQ